MSALAFTYFGGGLRSPVGQRVRATWDALIERLCIPKVTTDKHSVPGLSLATFRGDHRSLANVEQVFAVGLDFDEGGFTWEEIAQRFAGAASFTHSTWSSTATEPRARTFLLLSRPVSVAEYRRVYQGVVDVVQSNSEIRVDRAASDPSRFWFLPSAPPDGEFFYTFGRGKPVNVERILAAIPPPAAPSAPRPPSGPVGDVETRAAAYLDQCDPAISGSGGHRTTFLTAQRLVRGFSLDEETAFRLMCDWNLRCEPPWSEYDLRRKIRQAATQGTMRNGSLRDARRPG